MKAGKVLALSDELSQGFIDSCKNPDREIKEILSDFIEDFINSNTSSMNLDEIRKILGSSEDEAKRTKDIMTIRDIDKYGIDPQKAKNKNLLIFPKKVNLQSIVLWFNLFTSEGGKSLNQVLEGVLKSIHDDYNRIIIGKLGYLWDNITLRKVICLEEEYKFIDKAARQLVFPNYATLVSRPSSDNWDNRSGISLARKNELLLIGEFEWNGLLIAKSRPFGVRDTIGWIVNLDPDYIPVNSYTDLWICEEDSNYRKYCNYKPFRGSKHVMPLVNFLYHDKIAGLGKNKNRATFLDFNQYNLSEDNIVFESSRGARKKCLHCKRDVSDKNSKVIGRDKLRYCVECMKR